MLGATGSKTTTRWACLAALCLLLALPVAAAAADSWNGWITDAACGAKGHSADHKACAAACAAKGSKLVFFSSADKKIYQLDKQDLAKQHIGDEVTVTGKVDGEKIAVDSIAPVAAQTKNM